jgi:hypothetical protein
MVPSGASAYIDIVVVPQEPGMLTTLTSAGLGVRGHAPDIITPITYTSVYVYPAGDMPSEQGTFAMAD